MLIGLRLLGSDVISSIGICDIRPENCERLVREINQIRYPDVRPELPAVRIVGEKELFDTDVMIFCASSAWKALSHPIGSDVARSHAASTATAAAAISAR